MKVTLYSLNHDNPVSFSNFFNDIYVFIFQDASSKRIVKNLVDGSTPGKIEFKNFDDFIDKMSNVNFFK